MSERKWKMTDSGAAVYSTNLPATPLPAPDHGAARDSIRRLAYWANLWAEHGSDETLTRDIVDGDERDALAALAPHGEAVACVGWIALDAGGERMADELFVSQAVALREWPTANAVPVFRTHPAPAARVTIDDRFILAVEEEVGMGNGAWDMVPATALCEAVLKVAALSARTGGTE